MKSPAKIGIKSKKPERLRAAIVGCGRIASLFALDKKRNYVSTHASAYKTMKETELIAACDLDQERLKKFGSTWNIGNLYSDFDKMLRDEKPDLVSICTWANSHYLLAKAAAASGVKGIFIEKPLATNLVQADDLVRLCRSKKITLAVNHTRRWDEGHQKIKRLIESGSLGTIKQVSCYYTAGIANTGSHLLDLLLWFFGEADWISANEQLTTEKDPTLTGFIHFKNGVTASLQGLDVKDYLIFEIDIYGSKGRIRIQDSGFSHSRWKIISSPYFSGYKELRPITTNLPLMHNRMMLNAMRDFISAVKNKKDPLSTGEDGRNALEAIAALKVSRRTGRRITLPLKNRNVEAI